MSALNELGVAGGAPEAEAHQIARLLFSSGLVSRVQVDLVGQETLGGVIGVARAERFCVNINSLTNQLHLVSWNARRPIVLRTCLIRCGYQARAESLIRPSLRPLAAAVEQRPSTPQQSVRGKKRLRYMLRATCG